MALHELLLISLQVITWGQSFPATDTTHKKWFHESAEDQYGSIAQVWGTEGQIHDCHDS